ncbi:Toluene tolerance, Ttg2 [Aquimixticola soesokkakensis]|uniref:Toluene tolerance, Ttg2 n=1 Tax=Aquimixticola soesokkakensis TaxID=1519096 RepID=A0A1Y5RFF3_9RHOB|nr:ABC transporter substrate-binding protein [Aquimixticola soesokkakensis]SLN16227.1 Toluene tolerance, Ttg2 [Aquimixticola soesokkakensis]
MSKIDRRRLLAGLAGGMTAVALPWRAAAFSTDQASVVIGKVVSEINAIIATAPSEAQMYRKFEAVLVRYADVPTIARGVLGVTARSLPAKDLAAFTQALQVYISRKYGSHFREFVGGAIEVVETRAIKSIYEVRCQALLKGQSPFEIAFIVADASGRFVDLMVEGISLLKSERAEIGSMLDSAGGQIAPVIARLEAYQPNA